MRVVCLTERDQIRTCLKVSNATSEEQQSGVAHARAVAAVFEAERDVESVGLREVRARPLGAEQGQHLLRRVVVRPLVTCDSSFRHKCEKLRWYGVMKLDRPGETSGRSEYASWQSRARTWRQSPFNHYRALSASKDIGHESKKKESGQHASRFGSKGGPGGILPIFQITLTIPGYI